MDKVNVPEGKSGNWKVERFTISKKDCQMAVFSYGHRTPMPGTYTRLMNSGTVVMSDTDAEMRDHYEPIWKARGDILINGLGLGMVLLNCMKKQEVDKATVVEISQDVINLVGNHYKEMYGDKLEIVNADSMTWKPPKGVRYGMVWHDIWTYICGDNYPQMKTLHRRYGRHADWQGSWCRYEAQKAA